LESSAKTLTAAKPACALARAIFDAAVSAVGLIVLSPLLLAAAAAVALEDGRPVLFRQKRVGRAGKMFQLFKFRSMRTRAPGPGITASGDPRLTRVGRFLRKFKIDELPQLWNVVRGDMCLVGPRPEVPPFVNLDDPIWRAVLEVKPGITDLASLVYRHEEQILSQSNDPESYYRDVVLPAKLALNVRYLGARSFWRDMRLILLTVRYSFLPSGFDAARILTVFPAAEESSKTLNSGPVEDPVIGKVIGSPE
jgi:lipopolysaccharide/colanic/teichoic acid biosynthesis glycosyltransferase